MLSLLAFAVVAKPALVQEVVTYSTAGGEQISMEITMANGAEDSAIPAPVVVLIHGGAWIGGNRAMMAPFVKPFADQGFVVANISYRLAPKHKYPAFLNDAQTAVRFLRENAAKYNIDPKRIGACGASAGGHMALILGMRETIDPKPTEYAKHSSKVQCVFNLFGPTDFAGKFPATVDNLWQTVIGKSKAEATVELKEGSPVTWAAKDNAPIFTLHGTADPLVPVEQARILKAALDKVGAKNEMVLVEGMAHGVNPNKPAEAEGVAKGVAWMKKWLN